MRLAIRCSPALLAVVVYLSAIHGAFHFDDSHAVVDNQSIRSLGNLGRFFTDASTFSVLPQNQGYRPLLLVTYALTAAVANVDARAFIAVNLLVHVLCVLLFQALLRRVLVLLGRPQDERLVLISSAVFALHPIFSECVNYVSARSESLSALFSLLAIWLYLRARESGARRFLWGAALAMGSAMLVKAVAVTVPLLVALIEFAAAQRPALRPTVRRLSWLALPAFVGIVLVGRMTPAFAVQSASSFSRWQYFTSELPAILHYVALFLWPSGQSADPAYPVAGSFSDAPVLLASVVLLCGLGFTVRALRQRWHTDIALALGWFLICILPSSSVFPLAEVVNEHRPYLAAAGLCPLLAAALLYGPQRLFALHGHAKRQAGSVATALVLSLLAMLTVARNHVWNTEISLWRDVAQGAPTSARAQMNYGRSLMAAGQMQAAEQPLRDAVRLGPAYSYAHINLGVWLMANGRLNEAKTDFERAIALDPKLVYSYIHRGMLSARLGEPPSTAVWYFQHAVDLSPNHVDAEYQLASALMAAHKPAQAEAPARKAVELRGEYRDRFMLAYVLLELGQAKAAKEAEAMLIGLQREHADDNKVAYNLDYARKLLARNQGR